MVWKDQNNQLYLLYKNHFEVMQEIFSEWKKIDHTVEMAQKKKSYVKLFFSLFF